MCDVDFNNCCASLRVINDTHLKTTKKKFTNFSEAGLSQLEGGGGFGRAEYGGVRS